MSWEASPARKIPNKDKGRELAKEESKKQGSGTTGSGREREE